MIGTHSFKTKNSKIKQKSISANILSEVENGYLCSKTINLKRKYFALPKSAAEMKKFREAAVDCQSNPVFLPEIEDPNIPQLLVPLKNWQNDEYLTVSPAYSSGVVHEIYLRSKDLNLSNHIVQPTPAAMANHGEAILLQAGRLKVFKRGISDMKISRWKGNFVKMECTVVNMNISSGGLSVGFPALTAIKGFVHTIERECGKSLRFAVGFKKIEHSSGKKSSNNMRKALMKEMKRPLICIDEITARAKIVLLIESSEKDDEIAEYLRKKATRIAGGSLFDIEVDICKETKAPDAVYLKDVSKRLRASSDSLKSALNLYHFKGKREGGWVQKNRKYTIVQSHYALLEEPKSKNKVRNRNYPHAFAEPVFSIVRLSKMHSSCWFDTDMLK